MTKMLKLFFVFLPFVFLANSGYAIGGDVSSGDNFDFNGRVDILFVVDNSSDYSYLQGRFITEFQNFVTWMKVTNVDFRIAFSTTDCSHRQKPGNGGTLYGTPKFLTNKMSSVELLFADRFFMAPSGSDLEQGLCSSMKVLEDGAGFLRDDASLMLFYLSNEDDYSPIDSGQVVKRLDAIKPTKDGKRRWLANYYGFLPGDQTPQRYSEVGTRYISVAQASGGLVQSLFSNTTSDYGISFYKSLLK